MTTSRTREQLQRANQMQHRDMQRMAEELRRIRLTHEHVCREYDAAHEHRLAMQRACDGAMGLIGWLAAHDGASKAVRAEARAWIAKWSGVQSCVICESGEVAELRKERDHLRKVIEWAKVDVCEVCGLPQRPDAGDGTGGIDAGQLGRDASGRLVHVACAHRVTP